MATKIHHFTGASIAWRFLFALVLVLATYNPSGHSYFHWLRDAIVEGSAGPLHYFVGVVLIIGWIMFIRATLRSLGGVGILLGAAFFGTLMWLLTEYKIVPTDTFNAIIWIGLVCMAGLLTAGMCWSHIRRRLSGQYDVDDVESE